MMRLYLSFDIDSLDIDRALALVSEQRRKQVLALRPLGSRRRALAAYLLLCRALKDAADTDELPQLAYHENGKPFLPDYPDLHFNMSHCRQAVACAVSRHPVGVDVEQLRPFREQLMRYVCSDEEWETIGKASDSNWAFLRLWTRKEATLKLSGVGLRTDVKQAIQPDVCLETLDLPEHNCVCSVAANQPFNLPTPEIVEDIFFYNRC